MDRVVSLFSGAGGLSSGFASAGLKPIVAAELDAHACATYERNLGTPALNIDLGGHDAVDNLSRAVGSREVSAVIGGPPCQGFSTAGNRQSTDPRNSLIFNYFAVVESFRPRWFLFENVEGLLTSGGGRAVVNLVRAFIDRGYVVRLEKINFASYGLPQGRKRVVLVGNRLGADFELPAATHAFNAGKHRSVSGLPAAPSLLEAIGGLGPARENYDGRTPFVSDKPVNAFDELIRAGASDVSLHSWAASEADKKRYAHLQPGETMRDLPEELWHSSFKRRAFRRVKDGTPTERRGGSPSGLKRLRGDFNSLTITSAATREFIHPSENRPLTLREAARLQSFPDTYEFDGPINAKAQQIGNAFPPMCATILARHLIALDGKFGGGLAIPKALEPSLLGYRLTEASGMSPALQATDAALQALQGTQLPLHFIAA